MKKMAILSKGEGMFTQQWVITYKKKKKKREFKAWEACIYWKVSDTQTTLEANLKPCEVKHVRELLCNKTIRHVS